MALNGWSILPPGWWPSGWWYPLSGVTPPSENCGIDFVISDDDLALTIGDNGYVFDITSGELQFDLVGAPTSFTIAENVVDFALVDDSIEVLA